MYRTAKLNFLFPPISPTADTIPLYDVRLKQAISNLTEYLKDTAVIPEGIDANQGIAARRSVSWFAYLWRLFRAHPEPLVGSAVGSPLVELRALRRSAGVVQNQTAVSVVEDI